MRILSLIMAILLSSHVIAKTEQVELVTTEGVIKLELYSDKAPKTVANFLTYVSSGYYANTQFHRVIAGFMIQATALNHKARNNPMKLGICRIA